MSTCGKVYQAPGVGGPMIVIGGTVLDHRHCSLSPGHLGECGQDGSQARADALLKRAEKAERERDEQRLVAEQWHTAWVTCENKHVGQWRRADKAEASLAEVRGLLLRADALWNLYGNVTQPWIDDVRRALANPQTEEGK